MLLAPVVSYSLTITPCHINMQLWQQFKLTLLTGSVAEQLGNNRSEMVRMGHHYIKTVAEILLLCSQQDIPLRGHDESKQSLNRGNF